jgi:hypothetical protein
LFLGKPEEMEKKDTTVFNKMGKSNSMKKLSIKKKERHVVQIMAITFRTKSVDEPGSGKEIILNPIMKDSIINGYSDGCYMKVGKSKRNKRQKKETKDGTVEGTEEDQSSWLDTLKEEIANLK